MPEPIIPDWVKETPLENRYELTMFNGGGDSAEEIETTRDEYIRLKQHLAAMRGYTTGDAAARVTELAKEMELRWVTNMPSRDPQQIAAYLIVAREFYRRCPEAVVAPEGAFEAVLREMIEQ